MPGGSSAAYAAANAGIALLTRQAANEVARHNVRVNCLAPAAIVTDRLARAPEDVLQRVASSHRVTLDVAAGATMIRAAQERRFRHWSGRK